MENILLISDLDGTLLDKSQRISRKNRDAVRTFKQLGGKFTLATGRIEDSVAPYIEQLEIDIPVILYNGAKIYCPQRKQELYHNQLTIERELWDCFFEMISDDTAMLVFRNGKAYSLQHSALMKAIEQKDGIRCLEFSKETLAEPVTKLMFVSSNPGKLGSLEQKIRSSKMPCETVYSEHNYLEVLPILTSKGAAIEELVRMMQLEHHKIVAIGDHLNDLDMIQRADMGCAVANAHPRLKEAADFIAAHHERHAVASVIHELFRTSNGRATRGGLTDGLFANGKTNCTRNR